MTHELGHALGLPHDSGGIEGPTLMGRGLRQMRDYFRHHPGRQYGLSQASGIALAASPYLDVRDLKPRSMIFRHPEQ